MAGFPQMRALIFFLKKKEKQTQKTKTQSKKKQKTNRNKKNVPRFQADYGFPAWIPYIVCFKSFRF